MHYEVDNWLQEMANKYPELKVYSFSEHAWIEDNKGLYLAATPIRGVGKIEATAEQSDINCDGGTVSLFSRFYIIWRLNNITEAIFNACVVESSFLGRVVTVTTDIEHLFSRVNSTQKPTGEREFVAVEVEVTHTTTRNHNKCQCLRNCTN